MADSVDNKIFKAVSAIINASTLMASAGGYLKKVYEGDREADISEGAFPCVVLEPELTYEKNATTSQKKLIECKMIIGCAMICSDYDYQIIGRSASTGVTAIKGIMDIANEVKNAINTYPTLNYDGTGIRCNYFSFPTTEYIKEMYPVRQVKITLSATMLISGPTNR